VVKERVYLVCWLNDAVGIGNLPELLTTALSQCATLGRANQALIKAETRQVRYTIHAAIQRSEHSQETIFVLRGREHLAQPEDNARRQLEHRKQVEIAGSALTEGALLELI